MPGSDHIHQEMYGKLNMEDHSFPMPYAGRQDHYAKHPNLSTISHNFPTLKKYSVFYAGQTTKYVHEMYSQ